MPDQLQLGGEVLVAFEKRAAAIDSERRALIDEFVVRFPELARIVISGRKVRAAVRRCKSTRAAEILALIERAGVVKPGATWQGSATELHAILQAHEAAVDEGARRPVPSRAWCGVALSQARAIFPDRVVGYDREIYRNRWTLRGLATADGGRMEAGGGKADA